MVATEKQERIAKASRMSKTQTVVTILYTKPPAPRVYDGPPDMFIQEELQKFLQYEIAIVRSLQGSFFMSDVRKVSVMIPKNPNWWGLPLTNVMKRDGYYCTGVTQKSPTGSRNYGQERQWDKRKEHATV